MNIYSNIWKLYVIKGLKWFMIVMPIVVLFFQENGLSLQEVMILQGMYSFMVAAMEIPSGYLADVFGRKNTLILGAIFLNIMKKSMQLYSNRLLVFGIVENI